MVMNTQLERMVIMMNILKHLKNSQGLHTKQLYSTFFRFMLQAKKKINGLYSAELHYE